MLLLSHKFLTENQSKPRFQRIRQLAKNQASKEKIFDDESNMAIRIEQMGGIVFLKEL
jgi:ABC-type enterochelin transport system permease subunit